MDEDNVSKLPVRFKEPPGEDGKFLKVVDRYSHDACNHTHFWRGSNLVNVTYILRDGETEVECGNCTTKLDPMWVLQKLAHCEVEWERKRHLARDEMARLSERSKTACEHCGKMTRISRAKAKTT
jgi:hypothetical protein